MSTAKKILRLEAMLGNAKSPALIAKVRESLDRAVEQQERDHAMAAARCYMEARRAFAVGLN